jgi:hypothetical protein
MPISCRDIAILRSGAHRLAEIGGAQEYPERAAQQHCHHKGDQLCDRNVEPADVKSFVRIGGVDCAVIRRKQHQRKIQQQQRQREGQEDLRHVVKAEHPTDQEMLD